MLHICCVRITKKSEIYSIFIFLFIFLFLFLFLSWLCHLLVCYVTVLLSFRFHMHVQRRSLVVKRMEIKLVEYYAVASSGLIFFFEKNFHKEYIIVFVCIRLEISNTSISMCMCFHSERTVNRACTTLSYPISTFSLFATCMQRARISSFMFHTISFCMRDFLIKEKII